MEENKAESPKPAKQVSAFSITTFIVACSALIFSIYSYYNGGNVTNYNYGPDGNSLNFEAGSIAEVANKVSDSVVSITTEVRTQSWFGTEQTGQAAGQGRCTGDRDDPDRKSPHRQSSGEIAGHRHP